MTGPGYSDDPSKMPCPKCGGWVVYESWYRRKTYGVCCGTGLLLTPEFVDGAWMGRYWAEKRAGESFAEFVTRRARELREKID